MNQQPASTGFLTRDEWLKFGSFMLLLFGLSLIDRKIAVIVGTGAIALIIAQNV